MANGGAPQGKGDGQPLFSGQRLWFVWVSAALFLALNIIHFVHLDPLAGGMMGPDARFWGYGRETLQGWIDAMDGEGKTQFLAFHTFTFDLLFPVMLTAALVLVGREAGRRSARFSALHPAVQMCLTVAVPAAYALVDYGENFTLAHYLLWSPQVTDADAALLSALTVIKYGLVGLSLIVTARLVMAAEPGTRF